MKCLRLSEPINFENNLLRAVNAEKEIEKRKQLFEKLNKIAEKINGYRRLVYDWLVC